MVGKEQKGCQTPAMHSLCWEDMETTGELGVWWHPYEPYSGAEALRKRHLSD